MKTLKYFITLIISLTFINCSSDDERGGESCFECTMTGVGTRFCRVGNGNYTVEVVGGPSQEYSLEEDQTWEEFKDEMLYYCE